MNNFQVNKYQMYKGKMYYYAILALREKQAGWALLRAQNAPLALHFYITAYTDPNQRNVGRQQLIDVLYDV
ncbi:hypothetical protein ACKLTP_19155, partial [Paenarthrobacter ureafaciens]|uniref:hypothetical protein n=1 Tax=Paenarthrobacter ureafaciens TaxID=37931 RepID=UPI00397D4AEA